MPIICPTVMAPDEAEYTRQMQKVSAFAQRVQVDLTDGQFAKALTLTPDKIWWPAGVKADIHLMFQNPLAAAQVVLEHRPNLIIVQAEAQFDIPGLLELCQRAGSGLGVALLPGTSVDEAEALISSASHVMIFSGTLGEFGGHADLDLLGKVSQIKQRWPQVEVGWDGGINDQNTAALSAGGVDVLNVGGFIQHSPDPARSFQALQRIADETGTT